MRIITVTTFMLLALPACKDDKSGDGKSASTDTPASESGSGEGTGDTPPDTQPTGTVAVELTPSEIMTTMGTAIVSVGEAESTDGASLDPGTVALQTLTAAESCNSSGTPTVDQGEHPGIFAGTYAYCDLTKHPDGPDTTLGGIDRVQGILCALEGQYSFDGQEREITLAVTEKCFSKTFVDMLKEDNITSMTQIVTAKTGVDPSFGSDQFQKSLSIRPKGDSIGFSYDITLTQKDDTLAAAVLGIDDQRENAPDAFAINLNTGPEGYIRYEGRFAMVSDGDANPRHLRVLAKGAYNKEQKKFTSVTHLQYVRWDVYENGGDKFISVQGAPGTGYRSVIADSNPRFVLENYIPEGNETHCWAGSCKDNSGILVTKETDFAFAKSLMPDDPSYVDALTWFKKHGPLAYDQVTLAGEQD